MHFGSYLVSPMCYLHPLLYYYSLQLILQHSIILLNWSYADQVAPRVRVKFPTHRHKKLVVVVFGSKATENVIILSSGRDAVITKTSKFAILFAHVRLFHAS